MSTTFTSIISDNKVPPENNKVPTENNKVPTENNKVPTEKGYKHENFIDYAEVI